MKDGFTLLRCGACGFVRADVRGRREDIESAYRALEQGDEHKPMRSGYVENARAFDALARRLCAGLCRRFGTPRHVLDVGAGHGFITAAFARRGCRVTAVEPSGVRARAIEDRGLGDRVRVFADVLRGEHVGEAQPDLVVMQDVLEHLADPDEVFEMFSKRLSAPARFYIRVPNYASAGSVIMGRDWWYLSPPEHLNFFAASMLAGFLRRHGHRVEDQWTASSAQQAANVLVYRLKRLMGRGPSGATDTTGESRADSRDCVAFRGRQRRSLVGRLARVAMFPLSLAHAAASGRGHSGEELETVSMLEPDNSS